MVRRGRRGLASRGMAWRGLVRRGRARHGAYGGPAWRSRPFFSHLNSSMMDFKPVPPQSSYAWRDGRRWSADATEAAHRLESLESIHGRLTPELIVEDARDPNAPYHTDFDWDDQSAAHKYRKDTARRLVRALVVKPAETPGAEPVRAFVAVKTEGAYRYRPTIEALSERDTRKIILEQAFRELQSFRRKYTGLAELAAVIEAIDEADLADFGYMK